jgi:hypothetical protein
MGSFLRSLLPLMLAVVLGVTATPAHAGATEHSTHAGHALYHDGHCPSHHSHGHATMAECWQGGPFFSLSLCAAGLIHDDSTIRTRQPWDNDSAKSALSEAPTPPPRSA